MKPASRGYTIVEVLIVLAISTSLLFAAIALFRGQQNETAFTQTVQDLNSKLISYANQVTAGTYPDSQNYNCSTAPGRPVLVSGAGNLGGRQGCIFLGRAIQAQQGSSNIYVYTVLGLQQQPSGGDPVSDITQAFPEPAINTSGVGCGGPNPAANCWVMTDVYTLNGGAMVKSVTAIDANGATVPGDTYMAALYTDLGRSSSSGSLQLRLRGYGLAHDAAAYSTSDPGIKTCIEEESSPGLCSHTDLRQWRLCVSDSENNRSFQINMSVTPTGVTTQLLDNLC
jgi:prepilin-type N-terminal cleavage/methylation domain-containing protein